MDILYNILFCLLGINVGVTIASIYFYIKRKAEKTYWEKIDELQQDTISLHIKVNGLLLEKIKKLEKRRKRR
jgi:hypothetical protein